MSLTRIILWFGALFMFMLIAAGAYDINGQHPVACVFEIGWGVGWGAYYTLRLGWFS